MNNRSLGVCITVTAGVAALVIYVCNAEAPNPMPLSDATVINASDIKNAADSAINLQDPEQPIGAASSDQFEVVNGLRVRKDRNCTMRLHYLPVADGTVIEAHSCVPNEPENSHPYESYSDEALESLAYSDAKAAEVLGMRLRRVDEQAAMSLFIRASALGGGRFEPLQRYSSSYPWPDEVNGIPVRKTIHVKYVLSAVAELLGDASSGNSRWKARVLELPDDPERTMAMLDRQVERIVSEMREIQINVLGATNIEGGR